MKSKILYLMFPLLFLTSCQTSDRVLQSAQSVAGAILGNPAATQAITQGDIVAAFKEALSIGTNGTVQALSRSGAFGNNPQIRIPLPQTLSSLQGHLNKFGLSAPLDDLENRMNIAAERAVPFAKDLFISAISQMSFNDVMAIYNGPDDSATQFFKRTMGAELANLFQPSVANTIEQAGVIQAYNQIAKGYVGLLPDPKAELSEYVTQKGIDALFLYIAEEERAIRTNPAKRTTELLQKVFGTK